MDIIYYALRTFFAIIANLFFKDRCVIGAENIPKKGPVIICANHANQFLDAVLLLTSVTRQVGFIIAGKSYRRNVIGHFAKGIHAIPVERPQDLVKTGIGSIVELKENVIIGSGTKFTQQVKPGDSLKIKDIPVDVIIKQVESDTELTYASEIAFTQAGVNLSYKVLPKLDQSAMYNAVWQRFKEGGCVGIFPEGGSHDRTQMLPLKAGVCIMALGGMTKTTEPIKIVPCGFNYFKGHQFRSKAIVEFGVPYEIPQQLVETYSTDKKEAISTLLNEIEKRMKSVTLSAPSYSELTSIFLARKLYTPAHHTLTIDEEHLLNRILALGYNKLKDKPEVAELFEQVRLYNQDLRRLRLEDSAIKRISSKDWKNVRNLIYSFFKLIINCAFALPGVLLNGPLGLIINYLSEKERRKALAGSNVKVRGADVIASHKVLCAIVAFPIACGIWVLAFRLQLYYFLGVKGATLNYFTLLFFLIWPFYSYAMILSADGVVMNYRNLKARFFLLVSKSKVQQLRDTRKELQKKLTKFVETNAHYVLDKANSEQNSPAIIERKNSRGPEVSRKNSLEPDEALEQAFNALEEMGI